MVAGAYHNSPLVQELGNVLRMSVIHVKTDDPDLVAPPRADHTDALNVT